MADSIFEDDLREIAIRDIETLVEKGKTYGDSWKRRGGVGAFMMLARKFDRIENICRDLGWDVFEATARDSDTGVIDDIRDLRCYLMLVEREWATGPDSALQPSRALHDDNGLASARAFLEGEAGPEYVDQDR